MKVAIATEDCTRVDGHFGRARHFMIFDVLPEGTRHLRTVDFAPPHRPAADMAARFRALRGCALLFAADIGLTPRAQLQRLKVSSVLRHAGRPLAELLDDLAQAVRHPTPWVRGRLQAERRAGCL